MIQPVRATSSDRRTPGGVAPLDFAEFYAQTHRQLFASMWLITHHPQEAEEITQDAFVRVLERWDRVSGLDDPVGYLYRTATNVWRSRSRRAAVALRKLIHQVPPERDDVAATEARVDVVRAIAGLSPRQRAALVLTDLVGFTSDEAADAMGCRASTVRVLAARGRAAMKEGMTS